MRSVCVDRGPATWPEQGEVVPQLYEEWKKKVEWKKKEQGEG
jgi:hypothetical protein